MKKYIEEGKVLLALHCRQLAIYAHSFREWSSFIFETYTMYILLFALATIGTGSAESDNSTGLRLCVLRRGKILQSVPCKCPPGEQTVLDLGRGHVPRYLASFQCDDTRCVNPPYYCTGMHIKVQVLKMKETGEETDPQVPEPLSTAWKMVHVPVNIGCVCYTIHEPPESTFRNFQPQLVQST